MFNPNLFVQQLKAMPSSDDRGESSMESNQQHSQQRSGSGDRSLRSISNASSSNSSASRGNKCLHNNHLDATGNAGGMNASYNRNAMGMHPYMMDNNHANIANAYAMQAQASLGAFHPANQNVSGAGRDLFQHQQQAAMYHMINGNAHQTAAGNSHNYFGGLTGAIPFPSASTMSNYEDSAQKQTDSDDQEEEVEVAPPKRKKESKKKKRKKKPKDCPRRPLSGYNLFFKDERQRILDAIPENEKNKKPKDPRDEITWPGKKRAPHGKIGFESLAKTIGKRWKEIDPERLKHYKDLATKDLHRYAREMKEYEAKLSSGQIKEQSDSDTSESESEEEVKPVKRKKVSKSKKHSSSLKKVDSQDPSNKSRPIVNLDPYTFQHQLHQQNSIAGRNFVHAEQEQLFHLTKLQQGGFFGGFPNFNDSSPNSFFEPQDSSTNQSLSLGSSSSPTDFDSSLKKSD